MLSDAEERKLAEIESALRAEDPEFMRRFDTRGGRHRRRLIAAWTGVLLSLASVMAALAIGSVAVAAVGLTAAAGSAGLLATHRHG
jgi:hypothetical protein